MRKGIKNWPKNERPREMLLEKGPAAVSDAGLVAILLRIGIPGKDAVSLARELLSHFGGLSGLLAARIDDLRKMKGIKDAKIAQLLAATEIAKRQLRSHLKKRTTFRKPQAIFRYLKSSMGPLNREVFKVLYLNAVNQLLDDEDLFQGTLNEAKIYPREVAKRALEKSAYAVIFAHNHPSGELQATENDIYITRKLVSALRTVDIKVLDHIIVAGKRCLSMRQNRIAEFHNE